VALFEASDSCLPTGVADSVYESCHSGLSLSTINPKYPLRSDESATEAYKSLMCVQRDNSGTKGEFFAAGPDLEDMYPAAAEVFGSTLTVVDCATTFVRAPLYIRVPPPPSPTRAKDYECHYSTSVGVSTTNAFSLGDTIALRRADDPDSPTLVVPRFGGLLPLPSDRGDGVCAESGAVLFGEPTTETCSIAVTDLSAQCAEKGTFDASRFTEELYVGSKQSLKIEFSTNSVDDYVAMTTVPDTVPTPTFDSGTGDCTDALISVEYTVTYSSAQLITGVVATVTTGTISAGTEAVAASFSSSFVDSSSPAVADRTLDGNNVVVRPRSGNPGYIYGLPVLAGRSLKLAEIASGATEDDDAPSAVNAYVSGFPIFKSVDGSCPATDEDVAFGTQSVTFGEDLVSRCAERAKSEGRERERERESERRERERENERRE
jgi:hypothetical protein